MNSNYQLYANQLLLQIKPFHGYQKFGGIIHVLPKNVFIILLKNCGLLNSIENTNIDNIKISNELLINNSIVKNVDEIKAGTAVETSIQNDVIKLMGVDGLVSECNVLAMPAIINKFIC